MNSLNYNHLRYFWVVAREGGLVQAGKVLRLSHPTLSAQIHALEDALGEKLFTKVGRKLALTDVGRIAYKYAEEIFGLGNELVDAVQGRAVGRPAKLEVGILDVLSKLLVRRLLQPASAMAESVRLVCREGSFDRLLAALAQHSLDVVIADSPVPSGSPIRAHNHLLGECGVALFGAPGLVGARRRGFPGSLDGAPVLLPAETLSTRRALNQWFERHGIRPRIVAEFEDAALLQTFGAEGLGIFPGPAAVTREIEAQHGVQLLGMAEGVVERYYAITVERRLANPAVLAITRAAHQEVFAGRRA
ncbi:MAG TPA: transcriptional activator NhaR [Gemmatimonadaceae bacterium]|nr:transcriptional activator NhaR [Gemmatimonadaceae bacterium]